MISRGSVGARDNQQDEINPQKQFGGRAPG